MVGESGSGKTTTARVLLGVEEPDGGVVEVDGRDRAGLTVPQRRAAARRTQVVHQDPLSSLDPRWNVERVIGEAVDVSGELSRAARRERILQLLHLVRLDADALTRRPIELSGGQRQRVAIARALAAEPQVVVCDEPVSALDVSVQAQILDLLQDLQRRLGVAYVFISHDLGVIAHVSDRVAVMQDGRVVETGAVHDVFTHPQHAHTKDLLAAVPRLAPTGRTA